MEQPPASLTPDLNDDGKVSNLEFFYFLTNIIFPPFLILLGVVLAATGALIGNSRLDTIGQNVFFAGTGGTGVAWATKKHDQHKG